MKIALDKAAHVMGAVATGVGTITGYSIDTRTLAPGDLFFAIRGPNHDGHDHVADALAKGAIAAVVERDVPHPAIRVASTAAALERLAAWARAEWAGQVVGVTGSAGKTTTKEAIARMLAVRGTVGRSLGNLNNHLGVPLSLLRIPDEARRAVIEMGMNHAGEIRALAAIARPDVAVVTNVGSAHVANFDSIDGVAAAKRELVESLAPSGVAVLNADDERVAAFRRSHSGRTILYGFSPAAAVRAEDVEPGPDGMRFRVGAVRFTAPVAGRHMISNLLAAIAVAGLYDIRPHELVDAVRGFHAAPGRGARFEHHGIFVLDDCYNANPDAVRSMLDVLRETPAVRRIAVLGEMLELGRWAEPLHRDVGLYAAAVGVNVLVGIRGVARHIVDAAMEGGLSSDAAFFFPEPAEAGAHLRSIARPGDAILFKGSRGTHVERALERFLG